MQSLLFNPYWHALGGSERVFVAMARVLAARSDVSAAAMTLPDARLQESLGFPDIIDSTVESPLDVAALSAGFDLFACIANTPPPSSYASANIACIAFPFTQLSDDPEFASFERRWLERYECIVYSDYVRHWVKERWGSDARVIHPPVQLRRYEPERKERLVLGVGRFFAGGHSKRHDFLIERFGQLPGDVRDGWRFVLVGGAMDDEESVRHVEEIRDAARHSGVEIVVNASADVLDDLYARARIFVHATGLGRRPDEPELAEHFGIVTVEAMSAGAVPLVYDDGGQPEIVSTGTGYLWRTPEEFSSRLVQLMQAPESIVPIASAAAEASARFSEARFDSDFGALVDEQIAKVRDPAFLRRHLAAVLRDSAALELRALRYLSEMRSRDAAIAELLAPQETQPSVDPGDPS